MIPEGVKSVLSSGIRGLVTNVDAAQLSEDVAERTRGFRYHRQGTLGDRDFGTKRSYPELPTSDIPDFPDIAYLDSFPVYDPDTGQEHDVFVGLDNSSNTRVFVHLGTGHSTTSSSSVLIGTGSKTFTVAAALSFQAGERILIARTSAPTTTYMRGRVSSYSGTTLVVNISAVLGAGTFDNWSIYGGWMEQTRKIFAKVNEGGGIGASDTAVDIDTITDLNGVAFVPATSELVGYLAVNKGQVAGTEFSILTIQDAGAGGFGGTGGLIGVETTGAHGLSTNQSVLVKNARGSELANGYWRIDVITATRVQFQGSAVTFLGTHVASTGTIQRTPSIAAPSVARISDNTATAISTSLHQLGSAGLNWADNDDIEIYQFPGVYNTWVYSNGSTPHIRWNPVEAKRKTNLYYGSSASPPVMNHPVRIQKTNTLPYFYTIAGVQAFTEAAGWRLERGGGGLNPTFKQYGTPQVPFLVAHGKKRHFVYQDSESDPWMQIEFYPVDVAEAADMYMLMVYVVLVYDGYQLSDPIMQTVMAGTTKGTHQAYFAANIDINGAKIPKNVTGLEFYAVGITQAEFEEGTHLQVRSGSYVYRAHVPINAVVNLKTDYGVDWSTVATERGGLNHHSNSISISAVETLITRRVIPGLLIPPDIIDVEAGGADIISQLGHSPKLDGRTWLKPRYATRSSRYQGGIAVVDRDDITLLTSGYSGDGTHMDDVFPEVSTDVHGVKQMIFLGSQGEMMGLAFIPRHSTSFVEEAGPIVVIKRAEIEIHDVTRTGQSVIPADCVAKKSILATPKGLVWAGKHAIYMIPVGGGEVRRINMDWVNMYDGTLVTEDGVTPFFTDAYRQGIIAGWDQTYGEVLMFSQVTLEDSSTSEYLTFRLGMRDDGRYSWNVRKFGFAGLPVKAFRRRSNGTLMIAHGLGILEYPNRSGDYRYTDDVLYYNAALGNGIETSQTIHFGSIYTIAHRFVAYGVDLDYIGESVDGNGQFEVKPYANDEIDPFQNALNLPIDEIAPLQRFERRGSIKRLRLEMGLPTATLTNFKRWELSTANLWAASKAREGNR